eukprot:Transcript_11497.p1 GENE.Transcript_11497~~Transcript_11497.p1  ORF type:complete len:372 (+),score=121.26 Transcript_11497:57-1118(+)
MARAWLLCWALTVLPAAANRISFNYAADLNKDFLEQYQKEKEAKRQAQQEAKLQRQAEAAGAASAPAAPAPAPAPTQAEFVVARSAGGLPLGKFKLPAVVGLGLGAYRGLQVVQLRRLTSQLSAGQSELAELGASPVSLPAHKGGIRGQIAAHAEALRTLETAKAEAAATAERKAALLKEVSAAYAQLEQKIPASLAKQSEAELGALLAGLAERVQACAAMLEAYRALGQTPPDDFRSWPLERVEARRDNVTARADTLREVLLLQAKLGGARPMDSSLAEMGEEELQLKLAELTEKVEETRARRAKDVLLGKVEAALWLHRQEAPVGLASMSVEDLQELLDKLNGAAGRKASE